jgi:hypothetical protein
MPPTIPDATPTEATTKGVAANRLVKYINVDRSYLQQLKRSPQ